MSVLGDKIDVAIFAEGDFVDVVGTTKGKGFQGVVRYPKDMAFYRFT